MVQRLTELDDGPDDYEIRGRDLMTGIPKTIKISYSEIAFALDKSVSKLEEAVLKALETSPPELSADIYERGIYLTGGGALLRGLDKRLALKTKLPIHVADDPLRAVVRGTGQTLKNIQSIPCCVDDLSQWSGSFFLFIKTGLSLPFLYWNFFVPG